MIRIAPLLAGFFLIATAVQADPLEVFERDLLGGCLVEMEEVKKPSKTETGVLAGSRDGDLFWCGKHFLPTEVDTVTRRFDIWAAEALASGLYTERAERQLVSNEWREPVLQVELKPNATGGVLFLVEELNEEA